MHLFHRIKLTKTARIKLILYDEDEKGNEDVWTVQKV